MIVIFGGAFNPPTLAHYEVAKHILNRADVTELIFVPVGDHYQKSDLIPATHRVTMLEMMTKTLPNSSVSQLEVQADVALKTIETLNHFGKHHKNQPLAFVMGADNLTKLGAWFNHKTLIKTFKIMIINRGELNVRKFINTHFRDDISQFIIIDDFEKMAISSTQYRQDITQTEILSKEVANYICEKGLYQ